MAPSITDLLSRQQDLLTRMSNSLENLRKKGKAALTVGNVESRVQLIDDYWKKFQSVHDQLLALDPEALAKMPYTQTDVYGQAEEAYATQKGVLLDLLHDIQRTKPASSGPVDGRPRVSLPRINLPQFSGKYEDWVAFRDLFESLIIGEPSLSPVERLHYLKTSLTGEAAGLLKNLPTTNANFDRAWDVLQTRYDNKRLLVGAQIGTLASIPPMSSESPSELKRVLDTTNDAVAALQTLQCPVTNSTYWLTHLTVNRLDSRSRRDWETSLQSQTEPPTFDELKIFLENRVRALESIAQSKTVAPSTHSSKLSSAREKGIKSHNVATAKLSGRCALCSRNHYLLFCPTYQGRTPPQRRAFVDSSGLCYNCLGKHAVRECRSTKTCQKCASKHHTSLHEAFSANPAASTVSSSVQPPTASTSPAATCVPASPAATISHWTQTLPRAPSAVLLATARVVAMGDNGEKSEARALIDPCSEVSLISEALAQRLHLHRRSASIPVIGVGSRATSTTRGRVSCVIASKCGPQRLRADPFVLPRLTAYRPRCSSPASTWDHLEGLVLADPHYAHGDAIDLLLGADVYAALLLSGVRKGPPQAPTAQETVFGWILSGGTTASNDENTDATSHQCSLDLTLSQQVQRFWEQEEIAITPPPLTTEEKFCEAHYLATHSRQSDGRYIVRLPLRQSPENLGESRGVAVRTLHSMERRFDRSPAFGELYRRFLAEYEELGHMVPCRDSGTPSTPRAYLPHHGVLRADGRIRVVFNGSSPTSTGLSLNAIQHTGPKLLTELPELLLRWRSHMFAFVADIEKMYRQIRVHPEDWDLQRIVWRESETDEVCDYRLTTVTYGQACAPFLAIRTLHQLSRDEGHRFPLGAQALEHDVYVDDVLSGASTMEEASLKVSELHHLCMAGGFPLRKWASNAPEVLRPVTDTTQDAVSLDWSTPAGRSVLGLRWCPSSDLFSYRTQPPNVNPCSKRQVLSLASSLFDPLGWLAPVTIRAKIFLQSLWLLKIGWDDPLPDTELSVWNHFQADLADLCNVSVPRWFGHCPGSRMQLLGFADASEHAYAAVVYLRCETDDDSFVCLLAAKTRVAPLKSVALPRLELCGAVLLVRLVGVVRRALSMPTAPARLYTDSTVVLGWIRAHPSKWKTFVANRVAEIQTTEPEAIWAHVPSGDNPADCASRGIRTSALINHALWWHGPSWAAAELAAPTFAAELPTDGVQTEARCVAHAIVAALPPETDILLRFSSLSRLLRVTSWCLRWVPNRRPDPGQPSKEMRGVLQPSELHQARRKWILYVQGHHFAAERRALSSGMSLPARSPLLRLAPLLDEDGILRVGGRLKHAVLSFDERHPVILPRESHLTVLFIEAIHRKTLHGGVQLTLATLRRTYWVLQGRRAVKACIHQCLTCIRWRASPPEQLMAPLPSPRVQPARPFLHTGVDYAGPVFVRTSPGRGHKATKGYVCIFVCLAVRAVHIEVVSSYSADAFLAAYRRFASRRGLAAVLYSDRGTTFTGADAELRSMFRASSTRSQAIATQLGNDGTEWRFNPPAAPHFGGLWEAAVRSTKHHLRRAIGDATLTYEELSTLLAQIEACLNSRPLQALTDDPDDLSALTPAHFLVGSALTTVPEPSLEDIAVPRLSRWQLAQQMLQSFWRRWSSEYLTTLQNRNKWQRAQPNLRPGDLCLLRQDCLPPSKWPLARITGVHPDQEGHVRVVTLRTVSSPSITRPIAKVIPLLSADS